MIRREKKKLVRYAHLATGNYNSQTAKLYTDIGYITADESVCKDVATMFNLVSGFNILTGAAKLKNLQIVKTLEHLTFLADLGEKQVMADIVALSNQLHASDE